MNKNCKPSIIIPDKYSVVVVQNITERNDISCKLRQNGTIAVVVEEGYAQYQIQTQEGLYSVCDNNAWVQISTGDKVFDGNNLIILNNEEHKQKYLQSGLAVVGQMIFYVPEEKYYTYNGFGLGDPFPNKLDRPTQFTNDPEGQYIPVYDNELENPQWLPSNILAFKTDVDNVETSKVPYTGANKDVNIASNYFKTSKGFDFTLDEDNYFKTYYSSSYNNLGFYSKDNSTDNFGYMFIEANPEIGFVVNIANGDGIYNSFHATESRTYSEKPFVSSEGFIKTGGTTNQSLTADGGVFDLNTKADLVGGNLFKGDQVLQNSKLISNNYGTYSRFTLNRASNSLTTPTIPSSGTRLGEINFGSYNGTTFANVSQIASFVDATSGVGDLPSKLVFYTTPDNSSTLTERMSINNLGRIRIGSTMNYSDALNIESGHIAFQNGFGIRSYNTVGSIYSILYTSNDKVIIKSLGDGVQIKNKANTENLINITDGGNVSLGVANPTEKLEVSGNVKATSFIKSGGTSNQALTADGGVYDLNIKADLVDGKVPQSQSQGSDLSLDYTTNILKLTDASGAEKNVYLNKYEEVLIKTDSPTFDPSTDPLVGKFWFNTTNGKVYSRQGPVWQGQYQLITTSEKTSYDTAYTHSQTNGNPHNTTKLDIGLSNVDNTSDLNKPISTATQLALNTKADIDDIPTKTSFTHDILASDWTLVSGKYEAVISNAGILANSFVDVIPSDDNADIVIAAQIYLSVLISEGNVKVYSKFLPSGTISVTINIY